MTYLLAGSIVFLLYLLTVLPRHPSSHAAAFVRNGALIFGLGTLILYLLSFMELVSSPSCSTSLKKGMSLLAVVFVLLQMAAVIFLPRINLYVGWGGPHLGLMHLVATNVVAWIRHVLQESMHEYQEVMREREEGE